MFRDDFCRSYVLKAGANDAKLNVNSGENEEIIACDKASQNLKFFLKRRNRLVEQVEDHFLRNQLYSAMIFVNSLWLKVGANDAKLNII